LDGAETSTVRSVVGVDRDEEAPGDDAKGSLETGGCGREVEGISSECRAVA
jgi:hypothetical protein